MRVKDLLCKLLSENLEKTQVEQNQTELTWDVESAYKEIEKALTSIHLDTGILEKLVGVSEENSSFQRMLCSEDIKDLLISAINRTDLQTIHNQCVESYNIMSGDSISTRFLLNRTNLTILLRSLIYYTPWSWENFLQQALVEDGLGSDLYYAALYANTDAQLDFLSKARLSFKLHFIQLDTMNKESRTQWVLSYLENFNQLKGVKPLNWTISCPSEAYFHAPFHKIASTRIKLYFPLATECL